MLGELVIELASEEKISLHKSSLFQGVLMEQIDSDYGQKLHEDGLHPYSQNLVQSGERLFWKIKTLNQEAYEQIIVPLYDENFKEIYIEHNDIKLKIIDKQIQNRSYQDLISTYYFGECPRYINILFVSPTAFKRAGNYVYYPDISLVYNSLINKFDSFAENETIRTEDILNQLVEHSKIVKYNLRSAMFNMEGVKIPAFRGEILIKIHGPQPLVNLVHLLFQYGVYSGIGIKTAMGMGAIELIDKKKREQV